MWRGKKHYLGKVIYFTLTVVYPDCMYFYLIFLLKVALISVFILIMAK